MIARQIEEAMASYLKEQSLAELGGMYQFKTKSGEGADLPIRTGHDNSGELPEDGYVLVESLDASTQQEMVTLNAFRCQVSVMLCYPADNHDNDRSTLPSFDACVDELNLALWQNDLPIRLNEQYCGVYVAGLVTGIMFETGIDGRNRIATWTVEMAASKIQNN